MNWDSFLLFAQDDGGAAAAGIFGLLCFFMYFGFILVISIGIIAGFWKVFEKAGKPGWAAIVPIYNAIVMLEVIGKPIVWILIFFIPCVGNVIIGLEVAKKFGKDQAYGIGLGLLPFIFFPLLGFSDAKYLGPNAGD
jgi:hypothetical protein